MIVGLDISTSIVGVTFLESDGSQAESFAVVLPKSTLVEKCLFLEGRLKTAFQGKDVEEIWIEEPFQRFAKGGSTAATMMKLAAFNGMTQFLCYKITWILPKMVNANAARKTVGLKIQREKTCGDSTKEQVLGWVQIQLPNFDWPQKTMKSGPRRGMTVNHPSCYDIADSFVVAKAGFIKSKTF